MPGKERQRAGVAMMYTIVALTVLIGFCSLAVDLGRVQMVKTELRRAADAAARAGAASVATGTTQARADAITYAGYNTADGTGVALQAADVETGKWASGAFTVNGSPANAVRVTARRTTARGNPVRLAFAPMIGRDTCDVTAMAVATVSSSMPTGFIGLQGITAKNNLIAASYNSSSTTSPNASHHTDNAALGSNGPIDMQNNNDLYGIEVLGPSATSDGIDVHGSTIHLTSAIPTPADPAWAPTGNPGGIAQNYTVNSNTTLPGGTYWFTSLTINKNLSFSGPATLYVNGNISVGADVTAYGQVPSNLSIYQLGINRTFGDPAANGMDIIACISAPGSDFSAKNNAKWRGRMVFRKIEFKNGADLYYDEASGAAVGGGGISLVQ